MMSVNQMTLVSSSNKLLQLTLKLHCDPLFAMFLVLKNDIGINFALL